MQHRIVVLGAGYAGAFAAGNLARRLSRADTELTVVNGASDAPKPQRHEQPQPVYRIRHLPATGLLQQAGGPSWVKRIRS